jgi:hypothetical protein
MLPPLAPGAIAAFEAEQGVSLPEDYRRFLQEVSEGSAHETLGLVPLRRGAALLPEGSTGRVFLEQLGCGDFAFLVVAGPARGTVWASREEAPLRFEAQADSFLQWYEHALDWALARRVAGEAERCLQRGDRSAHHELLVAYAERVHRATSGALLDRALVAAYLGDRDAAYALVAADDAMIRDAKGWIDVNTRTAKRELVYRDDLAVASSADPSRAAAAIGHSVGAVRAALAANERATEAQRATLASDPEPEVRRALARNPAASADVLALLVARAVAGWRAAPGERDALIELDLVARARGLAPPLLSSLAAFDAGEGAGLLASYVVRAAALNTKLGAQALGRLAAHADPWVRHAVACSPAADAPTLARLAGDEDAEVRAAVAANAAASPQTLAELAGDRSRQVLFELGGNPSAPAGVLMRLIALPPPFDGFRGDDFVFGVGHVAGLGPSVARLDPRARAALLAHPRWMPGYEGPRRRIRPAPDATILDVVQYRDHRGALDGHHLPSYPVPWLEGDPAAVNHPWITEAMLEGLHRDRPRAMAQHPRTSLGKVMALVEGGDPLVLAAALDHPRFPASAHDALARHEVGQVREAVARSSRAPALLARLAGDSSVSVRAAVAMNPDTPVAVLERLAGDPDKHVRLSLVFNGAAPCALVVRLAGEGKWTKRFADWRLAVEAMA